jgi:hypothetical protein
MPHARPVRNADSGEAPERRRLSQKWRSQRNRPFPPGHAYLLARLSGMVARHLACFPSGNAREAVTATSPKTRLSDPRGSCTWG